MLHRVLNKGTPRDSLSYKKTRATSISPSVHVSYLRGSHGRTTPSTLVLFFIFEALRRDQCRRWGCANGVGPFVKRWPVVDFDGCSHATNRWLRFFSSSFSVRSCLQFLRYVFNRCLLLLPLRMPLKNTQFPHPQAVLLKRT